MGPEEKLKRLVVRGRLGVGWRRGRPEGKTDLVDGLFLSPALSLYLRLRI